jgi:hypothetical protein
VTEVLVDTSSERKIVRANSPLRRVSDMVKAGCVARAAGDLRAGRGEHRKVGK